MALSEADLEAWVAAHQADIASYHKIQELSFRPLSVAPADVMGLPGVLVYESPRDSAPQPSRYFIAQIDGDVAWVRVADHWGHFTAYRPDLDRRVPYDWVLEGMDGNSEEYPEPRVPLVGYVPISSLP
jgi:hypothetical protein